MSHPQQRRLLALVDRTFLPKGKTGFGVLEIGSYDVNGSARSVFPGARYVGVDLCEGPGVDLVSSGHEVAFPSETFDLVLSMECFEHNPYWRETFINMHRMSRNLVLVTCAGRGRLEHGTPRTSLRSSPGTAASGIDYYRNLTPRDFRTFDLPRLFVAWHLCAIGTDTYFIGWKTTRPAQLDEFVHQLRSVREPVPLRQRLFYFPLTIACRLLPDKTFQNFALAYVKRTEHIRALGRSYLRTSSQ